MYYYCFSFVYLLFFCLVLFVCLFVCFVLLLFFFFWGGVQTKKQLFYFILNIFVRCLSSSLEILQTSFCKGPFHCLQHDTHD